MAKERYTIITRGLINPEYIKVTGKDSHIWVTNLDKATRWFNDRKAIEFLQNKNIDNAAIGHTYE